ncbi:hypothetical protein [Rossellomorea sp. DUT-2]|uniref:hypothetical protein n=1 Tax=Rossellomorea sp. DUT-2 TaxID=3412021 RepID=UPI003D173AA2
MLFLDIDPLQIRRIMTLTMTRMILLFYKETGNVNEGMVGEARRYLIPMREMVEYVVGWMNENREET